MRDEPVFPIGWDSPGDEMDEMVMGMVQLMGWEHAREYGDDWGSETEDSISAKVPEPPRKENRMGFWTEWALQCYRAVMFPWHWLVGLEAYAMDIRYISPQD